MKRTLYWLFVFLGFSIAAIAQPRISNVRFDLDSKSKQIDRGDAVSDITPEDSVYVSVRAKKLGIIIPGQINGDIGKGVKPGRNRKVTWNVLADNLKINDDLVVKVSVLMVPVIALADTAKRKPVVKKTHKGVNGAALLTLGAGVAAGGGLYYLSTVMKTRSAESYEDYKARNWNHSSDMKLAGTDPDLEKLYKASLEQANTDYKKAKRQQTLSKAMMIGGIVVVVADAIFTIPMLVQPKNKKVGLYYDFDARGVASAGIQIKF